MTVSTNTIAKLNGYALMSATVEGYKSERLYVEQSENAKKLYYHGLLTYMADENIVGVSTAAFGDKSPEFVREYAFELVRAVDAADYFNDVIANRYK